MFEMVLSHVLLNHYGANEDDVDHVMRQREGAGPTEEGGKGGRRGGRGKGKGAGGEGHGGNGKGQGSGAGSGGEPGRRNYVYHAWHRNVAR